MADEARRQAREADRELAAGRDRGPLHGVPISIKDLLDVRGVPTTAASRVREGHVADRDAPAIVAPAPGRRGLHRQDQPARVRVRHDERGLGVRARAQPARPDAIARRIERRVGGERRRRHGARHDRHRHGRLDPHSGRRLRHRRPEAVDAARCRPTASCRCRGRWITSDRSPRTVADASLVYHALLGDARTVPPVPMPISGLRLAVPRRYFCDLLDDEVRARFEEALDRLRAAGARVDDVDDPACGRHRGGLSAHRAGRCGGVPRGHARDDAGALHAAGAPAARDGSLRAGRGLRAGARRPRGPPARGRRGPGATRRARAADAADSGAADRREFSAGRGDRPNRSAT